MNAAEFAKTVNQSGGAYHKLDLGNGVIIDGHYDMDKYLPYYGFPREMTGKVVLDVGTSSGYFAFEFERRGAAVTAIDLYDGVFFNTARELLGSQVRYLQRNIFDLVEEFGKFDLVFCGSLLLHLKDVFGAVERLRSVCKGEVIIATSINGDPRLKDVPVFEFVAEKATDGDYWSYWQPNMKGLMKMLLCAGFLKAEEVSTFVLKSEKEPSFATLHGVVKASV